MRCIDRFGPHKTGLSDVAAELGVTRQTVYRLFPSTEDLFRAVGREAADSFVDLLVSRIDDVSDPAEVMLESLVFTLDRLPKDRYLGLLLVTGREAAYSKGVTSAVAFDFAHSMLSRLDVDWSALGFSDLELDELVEVFLRLLQSFALDPGKRRTRGEMRAFLRRWLMPAINHIIAEAH
jgi:AcrR family transcriptional regulator